MKKISIWLLIAIFAVSLLFMGIGCKEEEKVEEEKVEEAEEVAVTETADVSETETEMKAKVIGLVLISGINSHCQELVLGVESVVEPKGDELVILDSQFDISIELKSLEDLISQKVDGIVLEVLGFETSTSALESAKEAGILISACDQLVQADELVVSQTVSDNKLAGTLCAQDLVGKMGEEGKVLVINIPGVTAADDREMGFKEEIAKYPGIEIVGTVNGEGLVDKAAAVTESMMQAHPDITAVFGVNDPCVLGALTAFIAAGKNEGVFFYGVDGSPDALNFVKEGKITGTVKQNPFDLGRIAAEDLYKAFEGIKIEDRHKTVPVLLVTSENVDEYLK
jgi:ribose transport system substrate-binding protein